jgi:hypothetical protein
MESDGGDGGPGRRYINPSASPVSQPHLVVIDISFSSASPTIMAARSSYDQIKIQPAPPQTQTDTPASPHPQSPYDLSERVDLVRHDTKPGTQRFVLTDPVAFRYLEDDTSTEVMERRADLHGYECYIVEQWTTSRTHPTFMITTFTGHPSHVVKVGVLGVPTDESTWSPRLRVYFKALNQYHARRRDTPLGILMVTNLSGFPSSLAVIPVPYGDVSRYRFDFFVNENLKRLGCSGRVGLSLAQPAASTTAKFHQLYRTSEKNDIYKSVIELVKLCQSALMLFGKLEIDYADGLLCDVTERAISDWWVETGSDIYNIEPHDGILGPTTVAALLGLLMGARNRLHAVNAPVSKDPFDAETMKRGISAFQKSHHLPRTRRLDRRTLDRLHKSSKKAADKERWAMPRAVKSTVAELSGKGGEMAMEAAGRRDRAGIAEIETVDMDRFVQLVYGDRCKWLWLGKPLKKSKVNEGADRVLEEVREPSVPNKGLIFKSDDHGGFTWAPGRKVNSDGVQVDGAEQSQIHEEPLRMNSLGEENWDETRHSMFKRVGTMKNDARSGLGKVKGAVGFRGHKHKPSVDESSPISPDDHQRPMPVHGQSHTSSLSSPISPASPLVEQQQRFTPATSEQSSRLNKALLEHDHSRTPGAAHVTSRESLRPSVFAKLTKEHSYSSGDQGRSKRSNSTATADLSIPESMYDGAGPREELPVIPEPDTNRTHLLRRAASCSPYGRVDIPPRHESAYPRHLSFSLAEDSVLTWEPLHESHYDPFASAQAQLAEQEHIATEAKHLHTLISRLQSDTATWTSEQLRKMRDVLEQTELDHEAVEESYLPHSQTVQELQSHSEALLHEERQRFQEGTKAVETLAAKLEYEIGGLKGKIEDVKAAMKDYEQGVSTMEERVAELEREGETSSWNCMIQ